MSEAAVPDPLDVARLRSAVGGPRGAWSRVDVVARTGSTNADLLARAVDPDDAPDRTVLAAEDQDAGRGRRTRTWQARRSEGLTVSMLLRPDAVAPERRGWIPLLTGLALVAAIGSLAPSGPPGPAQGPALKWPNDLLLGPDRRKAAGILVEAATSPTTPTAPGAGGHGDALVVGVGVNVATDRALLPEGGTSLATEGLPVDRTALLIALLSELAALDDRWRAARGEVERSGLLGLYRTHCATLGQRVRVALPGDRTLEGVAADVDPAGRLLVRVGDDTTVVAAGDVVHLRPSAG